MPASSRHPASGRATILEESQPDQRPVTTADDRRVPPIDRSDYDGDDIEIITHAWLGSVGPHPMLLTGLSMVALVAIFAHLIFDLPGWWPYAAGAVAVLVNAGLAYWQAGAHRLVTVSNRGIRISRKARWSRRLVGVVGLMPRMALGQPRGRWSRSTMMGANLWVHRRYHPTVEAFERDYLALYRAWTGPTGSTHQAHR